MKLNTKKIGKYAYMTFVILCNFGLISVAAETGNNDPLKVINNLSTFIFSIIRAVGMIILGFGIVQMGMSLKAHDPSQRANGLLGIAGGLMITFAKEILNLIVGG